MSKLNSTNVTNFHPILPVAGVEFDLTKFKGRNAPKKIFTTNIFHIYKVFHNFCYFIFIMPFKIEWDQVEDKMSFSGSKFHQVCLKNMFLTVLTFCWLKLLFARG